MYLCFAEIWKDQWGGDHSLTLEATISAEIYSLNLDYAQIYTPLPAANLKCCTRYGYVEKCDHLGKTWHGSLIFHLHAMAAKLKKADKRKSQTISILCWQTCEAWTDYVWCQDHFFIQKTQHTLTNTLTQSVHDHAPSMFSKTEASYFCTVAFCYTAHF